MWIIDNYLFSQLDISLGSSLYVDMLIYGYEVDSLILDNTWSVYYEAQNKE